jgi:hypothetical protein
VISATKVNDTDVDVCVTTQLDWTLQDDDESMKMYLGTTVPTSNTGSYPYKYDDAGKKVCQLFKTTDAVYFAIHFDVTGPFGNNETAWALTPAAECNLQSHSFTSGRRLASTKKPTKVPTKKPSQAPPTSRPTTQKPTNPTSPPTQKPTRDSGIAWGVYFTFDISCESFS